MATYPDVHVADLQAAYRGWPGGNAEKTALAALVLRVRIERAAARLPRTVIATGPDISQIERRLLLSIGEPGLSPDAQARRMRTVADAIATYAAICDLLHGRNADPVPSLDQVGSWTVAVDALEGDLFPSTPGGSTALPRTNPRAPVQPHTSRPDDRNRPRPFNSRQSSPVHEPSLGPQFRTSEVDTT